MLFKLFFILIIIINLGIPLINKTDVIFIFFIISILILLPNTNFNSLLKKKKLFSLILIITLVNFFVPKFFFNEFHQVFLNKKDIETISKLLPRSITNDIENDYKNIFEINKAIKSSYWTENEFITGNFINKSYAYSSDSFFHSNNFTRINNKIDFESREELRIGQINSGIYNLPFDKNFRRALPYYVLFEIDDTAINSKICSNKNIYYAITDTRLNLESIKDQKFNKTAEKNCITLSNKKKFYYVIGYSINLKDNLEIQTQYNLKIYFFKFLKYLNTFIIIGLLYLNFQSKNNYLDYFIYVISSASTIILTFIRDPNLLIGLRYFRGGADGLQHYSHGKDILENISNNNFLMALKGGEDVFYFMPGLRYFSALNNLLFGETTYGYLILTAFLPYLFYKIFLKLTNTKLSIFIFISFIFLPIFENMGFGYFNYVWQFARHHAETLSILFIVYSLYLLISLDNEVKNQKPIYLIGILLSLSVFLRPNFFPTSLILLFCSLYFLINKKDYFNIINVLLGYSLIFLSFMHNIYFGNSMFFFTNSSVNFKLNLQSLTDAVLSFMTLDLKNENYLILKSQLSNWNPLYNIHRLVILFFIVFSLLRKKQKLIIYGLFISMILQHGVLLISHPSSRYAYLAWLLTFMLFTYLLFNLKKKIK
jgi:hypothetical protein